MEVQNYDMCAHFLVPYCKHSEIPTLFKTLTQSYLYSRIKVWTNLNMHNLRIFIIVYSFSITVEVSFRGRGSISSTVHCTVLCRPHNCRTRALTLRPSFCCLKENLFHGYKTGSIPFGAWRPIQIYSGYWPLYLCQMFAFLTLIWITPHVLCTIFLY